MNKITIPYTYLIGWSKLNKWYYGVRYKKYCNPNDLWNPYKTSSKTVKEYILKYGEPDIIAIRKIFKNIKLARIWEHKVLRRMKVIKNNKFLNKTDNISICPIASSNANKGKSAWNKGLKTGKLSKETIEKQRNKRKNKVWWNNGIMESLSIDCPADDYVRGRIWKPSAEQKINNGNLHKGNKYNVGKKQSIESNLARSIKLKDRIITKEHREKISKSNKNKIFSETHKKNLSESLKRNGSNAGKNNPMFGKTGDKSPLKNRKWYNNNQVEIFSLFQPDGFVLGRLKRTKQLQQT